MAIRFDIELTPEQRKALADTDPRWWFTKYEFANAESPVHPNLGRLAKANDEKRAMVLPAVEKVARGARVLDLFCANGSFSFEAARMGATEVLGVDYDKERLECAAFLSGLLEGHLPVMPSFAYQDIYAVNEIVTEPFDVTLALGGLYHLPDPALALKTIRRATKDGGRMILQTSRIIRYPGSWAKFLTVSHVVDKTDGPAGVWKLSPTAVEALLRYAGFRVDEVLPVPRLKVRRYNWYGAVCTAI